MRSPEIEAALVRIKDEGSKTEKERLLKLFLEEPDFRQVVVWALDPRLTYGVAKKTLDEIEGTAGVSPVRHQSMTWESCMHSMVIVINDLARRRLSGAAAKNVLLQLYNVLTPECWNLLKRILLKRLDIGATESTVNRAMPGLIWTFDCMLAHPFEAKRVTSWPVAVEPKIDGVRCLILVEDEQVGFFSRSGQAYTTFDHLAAPLLELRAQCPTWRDQDFVLDCEIDSGTFNTTVSQARKKEGEAVDAVARCFDILPIRFWRGESPVGPYYGRRENLEELIGLPARHPRFEVVPRYLARSVEEIHEWNAKFQARGLEGSIVKPLDHLYERKRSYSWMKLKGFETHDLVITGVFEGTGKYEGMLGGVICDFAGVEVRVGGGFTDDDRRVIWGDQARFIGRMIEVGAHEQTPDGSLRHPRFIRFRDDKHRQEAA